MQYFINGGISKAHSSEFGSDTSEERMVGSRPHGIMRSWEPCGRNHMVLVGCDDVCWM